MAGGLARTTAFWPVRPSAGAARMSLEGRLLPAAFEAASVRYRRVLPVGAPSGDRLFSEPIAGTQSCQREPLFMPPHLPLAIPAGIGSIGWKIVRLDRSLACPFSSMLVLDGQSAPKPFRELVEIF